MLPIRTEACVLKRIPYGETDQFYILLTQAEGKIRVAAKGIRAAKSKLAPSLDLFNQVDCQIARRCAQSPGRVVQVQLLNAWPQSKHDLRRLALAGRWAELVDRLLETNHPQPEVYRLFCSTLQALEKGVPPELLRIWFEIHFLDQLGYGPILGNCASCRQRLEKPARFLAEAGGMVCARCQPLHPGLPVSAGGLQALQFIRERRSDVLERLQLPPSILDELANILTAALCYQIGGQLKSDVFLACVEGVAL